MSAAVGSIRRGGALSLLFAAGVLNIFDRQIVNILGQDIKAELHLTDARLGLLTGTAFGIFYALMGIPLGWLADRVDRFKLIAGSLTAWSACTLLCGFATNFPQLFMARVGVGVGEAGSQPASTALIPDLFPEGRRAMAMSMLLVSAPIGSFLGLLTGGYVGGHWGWRSAFVVAGVPGLLLAAIMRLTQRDPDRLATAGQKVSPAAWFMTLRELSGTANLGWLALAMSCSTFLIYASGAWFPPLFIRVYGFSTAEIGWRMAVAVGVGGGLGALGAGVACDLLRPRIRHIESKLLLWLLAVSIPALLATVFSADRTTASISMVIFQTCAFGWLSPTVRLVQESAGIGRRALAIAVCSTAASILSLGCGLPLVGAISDALAPHYGTAALRYALAECVVASAVLGVVAHWRILCALKAADARH
jgi:MFS transporter, Spinster family, sphingosine-1-phosphate transporter